ncbi:hypothetical protein LFYK43_03950 [Ligilactobacillus salitolerans]|uniref:Uncharacterized protein n=1 Tax=Ligilactobacillus salitolerans TaxID=1808352 RepID=A0A401IQX9_9LACO|nr:hypothetical protein [Ligilactobacillus salitolerans]GBG93936.1 hypothetical protein LFYK43_03950 [Ligilactobacillus salitolerans]
MDDKEKLRRSKPKQAATSKWLRLFSRKKRDQVNPKEPQQAEFQSESADGNSEPLSRRASKEKYENLQNDEKQKRLQKRLDKIILVLVLLIIAVFLVMRFINF